MALDYFPRVRGVRVLSTHFSGMAADGNRTESLVVVGESIKKVSRGRAQWSGLLVHMNSME